ncbi:MAG: phage portal protein [Clostridia bacterium]|nr:phage portal protein [Clostridia bacterium]
MNIVENMQWPPMGFLDWKMAEHSAWYSGDAEILSNFYTMYLSKNVLNIPYPLRTNGESFWGRQIKNQGEIVVHVPIAGDIAETSANFLFAEAPIIKIAEAHEQKASAGYKTTQEEMDKMLIENHFFRRILEGAETCAGIGGGYIKIAWDKDLSPWPIPVVVQADRAIPEFRFGILTAVTFWKVIDMDDHESKVYRLLERYERGAIISTLYLGTGDKLGKKVDLKSHPDTKDIEETVETVDELLAVYIPNMLPNRLDRNSCLGRSDYSGIEGLMDSLDEVFSSWIKDIALAQAKILLPESYMAKMDNGKMKYNLDQMFYVKLDMDPTVEGDKITPQQFAIRADEFEKTSLNLLDRIITSAGYSPQSFGLNIAGRAESGTALSMRERKSFATKGKKENYWKPAVKRLVQLMLLVYNEELAGTVETDVNVNIALNDGITNNLQETAASVKMLSDAMAASTETKVKLLNPNWTDDQVQAEVDKILEENGLGPQEPPDGNLDLTQMKFNKNKPKGGGKNPDEGGDK